MKNFVKVFVFSALFFAFASITSAKETYAAVDITLKDNTNSADLDIKTNGGMLTGLSIDIVFTDYSTVKEEDVTITDGYCTFSKSVVVANNTISIECFNEKETEINGTFATFKYSLNEENTDKGYTTHIFYIDETTLDLGGLTAGTVTNINKPSTVTTQTTSEGTQTIQQTGTMDVDNTNDSFMSKVKQILVDYPLYVLGGAILLIAIVTAIVGFFPLLTKKKDKKEEIN